MFGKLISSAVKIATLPIDAASAVVDVASGGDGSKRSRTRDGEVFPNVFGAAEKVRDAIADTAETIDD